MENQIRQFLRGWRRKKEKYTTTDIQNEMLQVMALKILRDVAAHIREDGFSRLW